MAILFYQYSRYKNATNALLLLLSLSLFELLVYFGFVLFCCVPCFLFYLACIPVYIFKRKKNSVTLLCYIQCLFNIFCDTSAHENDSFTQLRSHALSKYAVCVIFHPHTEDTSSMDTFVTESRQLEKAEIL